MKRCWVVVALAVASSAVAKPEFMEIVLAKYRFSDSSPFAEKSCASCHISDSDYGFNLFGKQLKQKMTEGNDKTLTPAALASLDSFDADGDGKSNGEELAAGGLPGFADGLAPGAAAPADEPSGAAKPASFPPKNGYHPALVHFPIALLIAGLLLDLAGLIRKEKMLLFAGWYNLVLAAVTSITAVASGFLAMTMMKLPYKGIIFTHMLLGIGVTLIMWMMVALRVHRHEQMQIGARVTYYALAASAFALVSWAGHLGGKFVYGD